MARQEQHTVASFSPTHVSPTPAKPIGESLSPNINGGHLWFLKDAWVERAMPDCFFAAFVGRFPERIMVSWMAPLTLLLESPADPAKMVGDVWSSDLHLSPGPNRTTTGQAVGHPTMVSRSGHRLVGA